MSSNHDGVRIADDPIYLNEDRYDKPKELFKFIAALLSDRGARGALLDVGCATGELVYYLRKTLSGVEKFAGFDISPAMVAEAKHNVPGAEFAVADILEPAMFAQRAFDVVTCSGVVSCFDDVKVPFMNLLSVAKPDATICIYTVVNDDPIDVIMRYRRADRPDAPMEVGWNIFSRLTLERILQESGYDLRWAWHPFEMPFELPKRPGDPMRTWTIRTEEKPFQTVNGACQLINGQVLVISVDHVPSAG